MCDHPRIIYLGAQKAYEGYNHYFKCLECSAVIVKLPSGKMFQVGGREVEVKEIPASSIID